MATTFEPFQELLGNASVTTTQVYAHVLGRGPNAVRILWTVWENLDPMAVSPSTMGVMTSLSVGRAGPLDIVATQAETLPLIERGGVIEFCRYAS